MASVSSVNGKKVSKLKFNDTIYDMGGSSQEINLLQYIIDNHKGDGQPSGEDLFYEYWGSSLDNVIPYCDFSQITSAYQMFYDCKNLTSIPLFNTSSCTNMKSMFYNCANLTNIPQLNTSNAANMGYMFYHCDKITTIPLFDTSNVTNMDSMFDYCSNLTTIPQLNTSKVTTMRYMFANCSNLTTIPQLDTSNVTDMYNMFVNCKKLTTIPQIDTSNVTDMSVMFRSCSNLTTIPQLNTSKVTTMSSMFENCSNLTTIDITHMKFTSVYNSSYLAQYCYSLTKFIIRNMDTIPVLNSYAFDGCYHFTGTTNATYNPNGLKDGRIYVPDDKVEALKTATNWSVYADIIVPLSTLVE